MIITSLLLLLLQPTGREGHAKKAVKYLDQSRKLAGGGALAVDSLFGKAYLLQSEKKLDEALQTYNVVLGLFPDYMPALIEKADVHLAMGDWEDAVETCHRSVRPEDAASPFFFSFGNFGDEDTDGWASSTAPYHQWRLEVVLYFSIYADVRGF